MQIQLFATWIFYAVLNDLCSQVAIALNQPKEVISVEMVFRSLAHFYADNIEQKVNDLISYLVENFELLGLVKFRRKRHREREAISRIYGLYSLKLTPMTSTWRETDSY